jgi:hypothetical protein
VTPLTVSWFSAGVSSAIATKLAIAEIDQIFYTHIDDQHPDTLRFVKDCEAWFGKPVTILQSPYKTVENALRSVGYVNGVAGAPCTRLLKRRVRQEWEQQQIRPLRYVWGFDATEIARGDRVRSLMPDQTHSFPLIECQLSKAQAHEILRASEIKRPAMYDLGYTNNNCIGCVKGGKGYWNKIRGDFPAVFAARASLERFIGGTCIKGVYLDELAPTVGRMAPPICDDCGVFCELLAL